MGHHIVEYERAEKSIEFIAIQVKLAAKLSSTRGYTFCLINQSGWWFGTCF